MKGHRKEIVANLLDTLLILSLKEIQSPILDDFEVKLAMVVSLDIGSIHSMLSTM